MCIPRGTSPLLVLSQVPGTKMEPMALGVPGAQRVMDRHQGRMLARECSCFWTAPLGAPAHTAGQRRSPEPTTRRLHRARAHAMPCRTFVGPCMPVTALPHTFKLGARP